MITGYGNWPTNYRDHHEVAMDADPITRVHAIQARQTISRYITKFIAAVSRYTAEVHTIYRGSSHNAVYAKQISAKIFRSMSLI